MARGGRLARLGVLGLLGLVTLTGCTTPNNLFWRWGWPNGITDQAHDMRNLWIWTCIVALLIGRLSRPVA